MREKELECISLIKAHPEIFTYDKQNDIYHSDVCQMSIGNTKALRHYIENYCKAKDRQTVGKLFDSHPTNQILSAIFNKDENRILIMPVANAFAGKNIDDKWLSEQERILHEKMRAEDKYISSSIEAEYDNYQSSNEAIEEYEEKSAIEKSHDDYEME